ncbi:MAG: hypothetical protein JKX73_08965 [Flavobacteriales bacterium]|nr:hypothetical protein [Flavobacteriales bacterium]
MLQQRRILLFLATVLFTGQHSVLHAQSDSAGIRQAVVLEVGGPAGYWSIGYEHSNLGWPKGWHLYSSVNLSVLHIRNFNGKIDPSLSLASTIGSLQGSKHHKFDIGISATWFTNVTTSEDLKKQRSLFWNLGAVIGYRFLPSGEKLFAKIYYAPTLVNVLYRRNSDIDTHFAHWAGLGIGYRIK